MYTIMDQTAVSGWVLIPELKSYTSLMCGFCYVPKQGKTDSIETCT